MRALTVDEIDYVSGGEDGGPGDILVLGVNSSGGFDWGGFGGNLVVSGSHDPLGFANYNPTTNPFSSSDEIVITASPYVSGIDWSSISNIMHGLSESSAVAAGLAGGIAVLSTGAAAAQLGLNPANDAFVAGALVASGALATFSAATFLAGSVADAAGGSNNGGQHNQPGTNKQ